MLFASTRFKILPSKRLKISTALASISADGYLLFFGEFCSSPERLFGLSRGPMTNDAPAVSIVQYKSLFHFALALWTFLLIGGH